MHTAAHVVILVVVLGALGAGFLGLLRPLIAPGQGLRLPGPRATALLFAAPLGAFVLDWLFHYLG
ncbi:MAG: hypothetical protein ACR2FO_02335 [Actinomycetota bacterium]